MPKKLVLFSICVVALAFAGCNDDKKKNDGKGGDTSSQKKGGDNSDAEALVAAAVTYQKAACACEDLDCAKAARQVLQDFQASDAYIKNERKSSADQRERRGAAINAGDKCRDTLKNKGTPDKPE